MDKPAYEPVGMMKRYPIEREIRIVYRNHRGEVAERAVLPYCIWFGEVEWHSGPQWLMEAYDSEKAADRTFAMEDIIQWT